MKVPWISKEEIAQKAMDLLEAFQTMAGYMVKPPVPVEDIIERSLGLRLLYEDLEKMFGSNDVLGATYVESKVICINERLFEHSSEGRLVFTCAHEAGHWVLHRRYVDVEGGITPKMRPLCAGPGTQRHPLNGRQIILRPVSSCLKKRFGRRFRGCVVRNRLLSIMSEMGLKKVLESKSRLLSNGLSLRPPCVKQAGFLMSQSKR